MLGGACSLAGTATALCLAGLDRLDGEHSRLVAPAVAAVCGLPAAARPA